jgi:hypothetical protein
MAHPTPDILLVATPPYAIENMAADIVFIPVLSMVGWNEEEERMPDYPTSSPWTEETEKER